MRRAIVCYLTLLLSACGAPSAPPAPNVIGDPLEQSLDKARSVEDLNGQRKEDLDEAGDAAN